MICNPNFEALQCTELVYNPQVGVIPFYRGIFDNLPENQQYCIALPGWESIYGTPDYSNANANNDALDTPTDNNQVAIGALGNDVPELNCFSNSCGEGFVNQVNILPNKKYILTYIRQVPLFFQDPDDGKKKQATDPLDFLKVNLTNFSEVTWSSNSYDLTQQPINFRNLTTETNLLDTGWEKNIVCFETNSNEVWDALYVYVEQMPNSTLTFAYLDQIELIEDTFGKIEDYEETVECGEFIYIGVFEELLCTGISDMHYIWEESVDGINWTRIEGVDDEQFIEISPTQNTFYRFSRKIETEEDYNIIGDFTCVEDENVIITVNVSDFPEDNGIGCCLGNVEFDYTSLTANTGSETWTDANNSFNLNSPVRINGDFVVPSGADLRIDGMTFEFGMNGRVIVEQGAKLILSNSIFTGDSDCQTMWQGVQVWGPGMGISQNFPNTGYLLVDNSRIEHALVGAAGREIPLLVLDNLDIQSWQDVVSSDVLVSENHLILNALLEPASNGGGYIKVTNNSVFQDCFYGLHFGFYDKAITGLDTQIQSISNRFSVENSVSFNSSGAIRYPLSAITNRTEAGIYNLELRVRCLVNVKEANFSNLKHGVFANLAPHERYTNCSFTDCHRGITAANQNDVYVFWVRDSQFSSCDVGIQASNTSIAIHSNEITGVSMVDYSAGIIARGSEFEIGGQQESSNSINNVSIGVLLIENDAWSGVVRNNVIADTWLSIIGGGGNIGTQISCNDLLNYQSVGIGLTGWISGGVGILPQQGDCSFDRPAGNFFEQTGFLEDIYLGGNALGFDYHDINASQLSANPLVNLVECDNFQGNIEMLCEEELRRVRIDDIPTLQTAAAKNQAAAEWYRYFIEIDEIDSALYVLEVADTEVTKRKQIPYKLAEGDLTSVSQLLSTLQRNTQAEQDFYDVHNLLLSLAQNNKSIYELNTAQYVILQNIAQHQTKTAYKAQALLYMADEELYPLTLPDLSFLQIGGNKHRGVIERNRFMQITPNPILQQGIIHYILPDSQEGVLQLYDVNGHLVTEVTVSGTATHWIDTTSLSNGLYFCRLLVKGKILAQQKILITK